MVIRKGDRVSTVLREDESLIEVFVSLSPAFERLRNPAMRRIMSRLVTVEQAARMAGADADELVDRLNARAPIAESAAVPAGAGEGQGRRQPAASAADDRLPGVLAAIPASAVVEVDVRKDLRAGREPFSRIMAARSEVPPGGALRLRAIFEPVPLYSVMERQGLTHHTEQLGPDDWVVWFYETAAGAAAADAASAEPSARASDEPDDVVILDVRGLEPPEPMVRTLAALETLPADATLVQINVRVPEFLLPQLEQRGFTYEVREQKRDLVRLFIRRAPTP
jgi:uncharacterized protein (DUF2249 family)